MSFFFLLLSTRTFHGLLALQLPTHLVLKQILMTQIHKVRFVLNISNLPTHSSRKKNGHSDITRLKTQAWNENVKPELTLRGIISLLVFISLAKLYFIIEILKFTLSEIRTEKELAVTYTNMDPKVNRQIRRLPNYQCLKEKVETPDRALCLQQIGGIGASGTQRNKCQPLSLFCRREIRT
jgi:hypothetical protein